MRYRHVLWDWNGTLIDDRLLALSVVNDMLRRRRLRPIGLDEYLEKFDHPVMEFYREIGLGPEVIAPEQIAGEFKAGYEAGCPGCRLQTGALAALQAFGRDGMRQSILSASHRQALRRFARHFAVDGYRVDARGAT